MSSNKANEGKNLSSSDNVKNQEDSNVNISKTFKELYESYYREFKIPESIYQEMDSNTKAADVWKNEGQSAAITYVYRSRNGKDSLYAEMRSRYG